MHCLPVPICQHGQQALCPFSWTVEMLQFVCLSLCTGTEWQLSCNFPPTAWPAGEGLGVLAWSDRWPPASGVRDRAYRRRPVPRALPDRAASSRWATSTFCSVAAAGGAPAPGHWQGTALGKVLQLRQAVLAFKALQLGCCSRCSPVWRLHAVLCCAQYSAALSTPDAACAQPSAGASTATRSSGCPNSHVPTPWTLLPFQLCKASSGTRCWGWAPTAA